MEIHISKAVTELIIIPKTKAKGVSRLELNEGSGFVFANDITGW